MAMYRPLNGPYSLQSNHIGQGCVNFAASRGMVLISTIFFLQSYPQEHQKITRATYRKSNRPHFNRHKVLLRYNQRSHISQYEYRLGPLPSCSMHALKILDGVQHDSKSYAATEHSATTGPQSCPGLRATVRSVLVVQWKSRSTQHLLKMVGATFDPP